jgi:hypothetical protein
VWPAQRIALKNSKDVGHRMYRRRPRLHPFTIQVVSLVVTTEISPPFRASTRTARVCERIVSALVVVLLLLLLTELRRHMRSHGVVTSLLGASIR